MTVRIGFTGTSKRMPEAQTATLWVLLSGVEELHHGDCVNADAEAHDVVRAHGGYVVLHPPTDPKSRAFCTADETRDPLPYLDRNHAIVDETEELVACPRLFVEELRSGTWATVRYARSRQRRVTFVWPDGSVTVEHPTQTRMI